MKGSENVRQHFDICGDYQADNPFLERQSFKCLFMKYAFLAYKKARISISKFRPLKDWQEYLWREDEMLNFRQFDNSAIKCIEDEPPFFHIKHISILELIPKEDWDVVIKGIEHFRFKHAAGKTFNSHSPHTNWFNSFNDGHAYSLLDTIQLKGNSVLKKYVSQISFHAVNLSSSFFSLKITAILDKDIVNRLSNYVIGNIPDQIRITGFENKHWYEFSHLAYGTFSGSIYKRETFESILKDLTWQVAKEVQRFIPSMLFTSQQCCPQYVCSIKTNIDGNSNKDFWSSIDIDSRWCDFSPDLTSCIAWRVNGEPLFIFSVPQSVEQKMDVDVESYHIADKLCYCLLYEKVSQYVRNRLSMFSNKISNNRRHLRSWLKLKVDFDAEMFFSTRFLNEVEEQTNNSFSYITLRPSKETFISVHYSDLFESVRRTVDLYTGISALFQSNIDYMSTKNNFSTQNKALYVSILAVIVAIISIVITIIIAIATNEDAIKKLFELLQTFVKFEK